MSSKIFALITGVLILASCTNDDPVSEITKPTTPTTSGPNINANKAYRPEFARIEMPGLHRGNDTILIHKSTDGRVNYITEWDYQRKTQRWSCYVLDKDYLAQNTNRYYSDTNQYPDDELIPESMQWLQDPYYRNGMGFDHGHICPSADRLYAADANYQTFYLTNMQPQFSAFNAGLWAKMEAKVRAIAKTCDTLYICKGGTVDEGIFGKYSKIYLHLPNGLIVPRYFFMALLRVTRGQYTAVGLWTDQVININDSGVNMGQYAISIDELEKRTGIDFFCNLPDKTENEVEKSFGTTGSWSMY